MLFLEICYTHRAVQATKKIIGTLVPHTCFTAAFNRIFSISLHLRMMLLCSLCCVHRHCDFLTNCSQLKTNYVSFRIRAVGTAAVNMCLVATGGADAYYEMGIHCWDMAGAGIIITEAGGVLLDVSGKYRGSARYSVILLNS